jgi:hypothetical protein
MQPETATEPERAAPAGFGAAQEFPLWRALFSRRTRRISRGLSFESGALTFASKHEPQPLSPLEEALLLAATGVSGIAIPDNPYHSETGEPLAGTVLLRSTALTAPSPDNAHATHFFLWNDTGTYLLKHPDQAADPPDGATMGPDELVRYVDGLKVKLSDERAEFGHKFPAELHRNRFASNVPGSTLFAPVVELTEQYINGLLLMFSQADGMRPVVRDDFNLYRVAGLQKYVRNGYLNRDLPFPLSPVGRSITEFESLFLLQNLALTAEAMGLGGWIHWAPPALIFFGGTPDVKGLGFRFHEPEISGPVRSAVKPAVRLRRKLRPFPAGFPNPVGLDGHIESYCPPYYRDMDAAIDAVLAKKFSGQGIYKDPRYFGRVFKPELIGRFLDEVPSYPDEAIECTRAVCRYVYETYGRFPAHANAVHAPSTWFQAHHVDTDYYDSFYQGSYGRSVADHQRVWHP